MFKEICKLYEQEKKINLVNKLAGGLGIYEIHSYILHPSLALYCCYVKLYVDEGVVPGMSSLFTPLKLQLNNEIVLLINLIVSELFPRHFVFFFHRLHLSKLRFVIDSVKFH